MMRQTGAARRFVPPAVAMFSGGTDAAVAEAVARARDEAFIEGREHGRREGHAEGRQEGEAEARETLQRELDALRTEYALLDQRISVTRALERVLDARTADLAALEAATRTVVAAALRTLFPTLLSHASGSEIESLLQQALAERAGETLLLCAHPSTLDAVRVKVAACQDLTRVTLVPTPSLTPGAAEIVWTGGGLTFDPSRLLEHVVSVFEAAVPPIAATASTPSNQPTKESST